MQTDPEQINKTTRGTSAQSWAITYYIVQLISLEIWDTQRNIKILWINRKKTVCEINKILDLIDINFKVVIINMFKEQNDPDQRHKGECDNSVSSREKIHENRIME